MPLSKKQKAIIALLDDRIPPLKDAVGVIPPDPPVFPLVIQPDPPVPLSIEDRRLIAETLRQAWMTPKEWKSYRARRELERYEAIKKLAKLGVARGRREDWIQGVYGKSKQTLSQYFSRKRAKIK